MIMCQKLRYENPRIDACLIQEIKELNKNGFKTLASCCGHDRYPKTIIGLKNGKVIELISGITIEKKKHNQYYRRDKQGFYYLYCNQPLI